MVSFVKCLLLVAMATLLAGAQAALPKSAVGSVKNAWPEVLGLKSAKAVEVIKASGIVNKVYVWAPTYETGKKGVPADRGTPDDVWVYTDQNDEVYEIPHRGVWHPNRLAPGWPNLKGKDLEYATKIILRDFFGALVLQVSDQIQLKLAYDRSRVVVKYDKNGKVSATPFVF